MSRCRHVWLATGRIVRALPKARVRAAARGFAAFGLVAATLASIASAQVRLPRSADDPPPVASYLSQLPETDAFRIQVYGDAFAEGLLGGLVDAFGNEGRFQLQKKVRTIGPLVRPEWEEEARVEEAQRDLVHIGVVMLGLADRQIMRLPTATRPLSVGSPDWQTEYGGRLDRWLKLLKRRGMAVYLVGQPALRRSDFQRDAEMLNEIMREKANANGIRFIDVMEAFQDENGVFSQFGPDLSGNRQRLREGDGISFTPIGNRMLAHFIEREVRRDIARAITERAVPLAGNPEEQRRINPNKVVGPQPVAGSWKGSVAIAGRPGSQTGGPAVPDGAADQKADNGRVTIKSMVAGGREETVTLDIVRPAIPAAVVSLLTRKEVNERGIQPGETLVEALPNGATLVSTVSTLGDTGAGSQQRRRAGAMQTPSYTVLVKGDRLTPKPGRADDFSWPRPEATAAAVAPEPSLPPRPATPSSRMPQR
jgi:hypothetical protein